MYTVLSVMVVRDDEIKCCLMFSYNYKLYCKRIILSAKWLQLHVYKIKSQVAPTLLF